MTLGFFTVFRKDPRHYLLARQMVKSVWRHMPGLDVVQFTDQTSPTVPGVEVTMRYPHGKMLERRLEHYASVDATDWIFVDTDIVFQRDVRDVFTKDFDVALTDRQWPHVPQSPQFIRDMPFNTGVAFSRSPAFWQAVLETWRGYTPDQQADWMSEQRAVAHVVKTDAFTVCVLPGMVYNYPPSSPEDAGMKGAAIVHYKGARKIMATA